MTSVSALNHIHKTGLFGNHENKNEESLLKISEIKNLLIVQIVQYKNSSISIESINIDSLKLKNEPLAVISNNEIILGLVKLIKLDRKFDILEVFILEVIF